MHSWPALEKQARVAAVNGVEVRALGDDHRVLAAELGGEADQPAAALVGEQRPVAVEPVNIM